MTIDVYKRQGIYRDVYLDVKDEYYIEDIYTATPDVRTDEKILKAQIKLNAYTEGLRPVSYTHLYIGGFTAGLL